MQRSAGECGDISGIERLKSVLQNRFFSLAGLIQASTALRKAWDPCNIALLRFRELLERRTQDASVERQRLLARQAIRERKAEEAYQDWVRQLRDRAYVESRLEEK